MSTSATNNKNQINRDNEIHQPDAPALESPSLRGLGGLFQRLVGHSVEFLMILFYSFCLGLVYLVLNSDWPVDLQRDVVVYTLLCVMVITALFSWNISTKRGRLG